MPHYTGRHGDSFDIESPLNSISSAYFAGDVTTGSALTGATGTVAGVMCVGDLAISHVPSGGPVGSTWSATTAPILATNQAYLPITIGGTAYRIPLFAIGVVD